jgi:hypothetical protein
VTSKRSRSTLSVAMISAVPVGVVAVPIGMPGHDAGGHGGRDDEGECQDHSQPERV